MGYGLEGVLTPTFLNQVANDYVVPYLADEDYDAGCTTRCSSIGTEILDKYEEPESGDPAFPIGGVPLTTWQWVVIIVVMVALTAVTRGASGTCCSSSSPWAARTASAEAAPGGGERGRF